MRLTELDKKIKEYAVIKTGKERVKNYELRSNFPELHPLTKIHALDAIINHAKDVCGPFGGIYGDLTAQEMIGGQTIKDGYYTKSKDGYSFLSTLKFGARHAETIKASLAQLGKYIASYEGETSRDGTTSVAIVGCAAAKYLLASRLDKKDIPSTMMNIIFDNIMEAGSTLIENNKVPVYKDGFYTREDGKKLCLSAIKTTVDNNGIFVEAFEELMNEADGKYDLNTAFKSSVSRRNGVPDLELNLIPGIKFRAQALSEKYAGGFLKHRTLTFVLDGFISRHQINTFKYGLMKWIKDICSIQGGDGCSIFDPNGMTRLDPPLFIITRTPDYVQNYCEEVMQEGIAINSRGKTIKVYPRFMLGANTEDQEIHFADMTEVFSDITVDLNAINQYILCHRVTPNEPDPNNGGLTRQTTQTEVNISKLFPRLVSGDTFEVEIPYSDVPFDKAMKENQEAKFDKTRKNHFSIDACRIEVSYDGMAMYLSPNTSEQLERVKAKRDALTKLKDSYDDNAIEANILRDRLAFFSGLSIKPVIYCRGEDEYQQLFSIYEDALGVFESIHAHGIMPGSNSFILKVAKEFHLSSMVKIGETLLAMGIEKDSERYNTYMEFAENVLTSILESYKLMISILVKDGAEDIITQYQSSYVNYLLGMKDETSIPLLTTYDVVTGQWSERILEAARTTADVFAGAVTMSKDMIMMKRIRIIPESPDYQIISKSNQELPLHTIYDNIKED